ncbi:carbohydrate-binding protein [Bradyrhizobium zhanjiangense]|uniref:Chitin-binding type-3 domain-containing protein n=1 Tax=Bradyrhizobium zhanjiangense TaxID=1325107 RepID=A0A4Q0SRM9_9BRAD|nr:carbohydrate-binding protein [Bradyrhizobium zhanjiangense]RXH41059.1 hypothetical protein XH94_09455 [Bradyrhizobium zhanjiangense]
MTALVSYSTGTATVSAGGTTVTGIGTIWSGVNARPGDILQVGNYQSVISDVVDTGTLTIPPWGGGAQTAVAYKIWQVSPQRFAGAQAMADVNTLVAALNTTGFFVFVGSTETVPDPSLGNEEQYAFQPTTGKTWVKSGGVWSYLGIYKAFQLKGAWSGATAYTVGDVVSLSGSSYACILDHTNHTPPNTTYWQLLASIGATGNTGATGAGYGGTSTTSLTIGTGSKAFTTQSGLAYINGARVRASSAANTSNWMEGLATYTGTSLTITVDKTNGSGTLADWNFNIVGQPGAGDLSSANNLSDLANVATARANLGLTEAIVTAAVGQLPGTTGTTQPAAGKIGERITATATVSLVSATAKNVTSINPGAGVWDLEMVNAFDGPGATTSSDWISAMSTTTASTVSGVVGEAYHTRLPSGADMSIVHSSRRIRVTTAGSTPYYLNAQATYSGASYSCTGTIQATRVS